VLVTLTGPVLIRPPTATTDIDGSYRFPAVPPGDYVVSFELSQFQTVRREGIRLTMQTVLTFDARLAPASVSAEVNVVATAPVVDVKSTSLGTSFTNSESWRSTRPAPQAPWARPPVPAVC